jgi:ABC-type bacteriocin/lantibiotic exporter with double-glycine peptidase domain
MRAMLRHLRTGREPLWAVLLLLISFVSFFSFLLPSSFKAVVDSLLPRGNEHQFHLFCAAMLALVLARTVLNALQDYLFLRVRQHLERSLLVRYCVSVIHLPLARWNTLSEADLVNRISLILTNLQSLLPELVYYCAYALCVSVAVTVVLSLINPVFLAISAVFLILHATNFFLHYRISRRFSTEYASARGQLATVYRDLLRGRKYITLAGLQQAILDGLDRDNRLLYRASFRRDLVESALSLLQQLLHGLNYLALVVFGSLAIFAGSMSAGSMGLSLLLIGFAYEPVYRLSKLTKALSETEAQFARVLPLLSDPATAPPSDELSTARHQADIEQLELRRVTFERAGAVLLREVDFTFVPGAIYVITGPSGSGKTTLLQLLAGLLPPTAGQVLYNGRAANAHPAPELSSLMTYCPQQSLLFEGTVQDNLTLFEREPDPEGVTRALRLGAAEDFMDQARAASLLVENEGANFSGGQKQRLHLARTWYQAAPVMLFDEPTANLDKETEELFLQRLVGQAPGRIILIVSHSAATQRYAHRVLLLAGGTLAALPSIVPLAPEA